MNSKNEEKVTNLIKNQEFQKLLINCKDEEQIKNIFKDKKIEISCKQTEFLMQMIKKSYEIAENCSKENLEKTLKILPENDLKNIVAGNLESTGELAGLVLGGAFGTIAGAVPSIRQAKKIWNKPGIEKGDRALAIFGCLGSVVTGTALGLFAGDTIGSAIGEKF
jgi:hypothetical protein